MPSPTIYFIRHGQTDWNKDVRLQGQRDIPLNLTGRAQAARNGGVLAELLDDPQGFHFVASPLTRTRETMEIVREQLGLPREGYAHDDRLMEIAFGDWEGLSWTEIRAAEPGHIETRASDPFNFRAPGNAESYADLTARILPVFEAIERDTVVVSHGGVSRVLRGHLLRLAPEEITELKVPQDKVMRIEGDQIDWI